MTSKAKCPPQVELTSLLSCGYTGVVIPLERPLDHSAAVALDVCEVCHVPLGKLTVQGAVPSMVGVGLTVLLRLENPQPHSGHRNLLWHHKLARESLHRRPRKVSSGLRRQ